ncbi:MAG: hypothetical protein WCB70_17880, partial [Xanthobacteraceae bacterium]
PCSRADGIGHSLEFKHLMDKVRHRLCISRNRTPQFIVGQICALHLTMPEAACSPRDCAPIELKTT